MLFGFDNEGDKIKPTISGQVGICPLCKEKVSRNFMYWVDKRQYGLKVSSGILNILGYKNE